VWEEGLQPVPARLVSSRLSALTRTFLTMVGLPTDGIWGSGLFHDERLSVPVSWMGREYLPLGELYDLPVVIEPTSDAVYTLVGDKAEFINSDVRLFVFFLGVLEKEKQRLDTVTGMVTEAFVDLVIESVIGIRHQMRDRDPAAIQENGWWNGTLDEMIEQAAW
jgi:hypothetical protein